MIFPVISGIVEIPSWRLANLTTAMTSLWLLIRFSIKSNRKLNQVDIKSKSDQIERFLRLLNEELSKIESNRKRFDLTALQHGT